MKEAAMRLGLSVRTVRAFVEEGALNCIPVGEGKKRKRRMFSEKNLEMFISQQSDINSASGQTASSKRNNVFHGARIGLGVIPSGRTPNSKALTDKWEKAAAEKLYKSEQKKRVNTK
jgi:DNA-binding transcriptional MerR regulator